MKGVRLLTLRLAVLLASQHSVAADPLLGRLFYTPAQRTQLEQLRQHLIAVDPAESPIFTIDGEVRRSSGHDSYWINGKAEHGQRPLAHPAKIGERLDHRRGTVEKLLGDGLLQIHPPSR